MQRNWMNNSKNPHIPITRRPHLSLTNYPNNVLSSQKRKRKNAFQDHTLYLESRERGRTSSEAVPSSFLTFVTGLLVNDFVGGPKLALLRFFYEENEGLLFGEMMLCSQCVHQITRNVSLSHQW